MNHPVTDGDRGIVLDRRTYPQLGPDGDGIGPVDIVDAVHGFVTPRIRNRLVGILHGCLEHQTCYDEDIAWGYRNDIAA